MTTLPNDTEDAEEAEVLSPTWIAEKAVDWSVRFVVTTTIVNLVPVDSKTDKVKVVIGSYMIASVVCDKTNDKLHEHIASTRTFISEVKKASAELKSSRENNAPNP